MENPLRNQALDYSIVLHNRNFDFDNRNITSDDTNAHWKADELVYCKTLQTKNK